MLSSSSLHSSSTLLASSPNNSICEVTDIETEEISEIEEILPETEPVKKMDDSSSVSIYESPMSSIYVTPVSSPTYATPSEGRSPWASPRQSLRSSELAPPQRGETVNHNRPFTG